MKYELRNVEWDLVSEVRSPSKATVFIAGNSFILHQNGGVFLQGCGVVDPNEYDTMVSIHKFYDSIQKIFPDVIVHLGSRRRNGSYEYVRRHEKEDEDHLLGRIMGFSIDSELTFDYHGIGPDYVKEFDAVYGGFAFRANKEALEIKRGSKFEKGQYTVVTDLAPRTSGEVEEFFNFLKKDPNKSLAKLLGM